MRGLCDDGLAGLPSMCAAARAGAMLGNGYFPLSGVLQGSPLVEAWGALGWRGKDVTAEAALPATVL